MTRHRNAVCTRASGASTYGEVSEFRNDGAVDEDLRADDGPDGSNLIKGMVLETALLQKVRRCI